MDPDNETISDLTPFLDWNSASNADSYEVNISKYPYGSSNIVYSESGITSSSHTVDSGYLTYGTDYRWDVTAVNNAGETTSDNAYFTTAAAIPATPSAYGPGSTSSPGPILSDLTPTFDWSSVSGADWYEINIRNLDTNGLITQQVTSSQYTPSSALASDTPYRWDVTAGNTSGESTPTSDLYFQTAANTTYTLTPSATSVTEGNQVIFTVSRSGDKPPETVYFSTLKDSASYEDGDYATTSGGEPKNISVNFSSGETSETIAIDILDDGVSDSDERFRAIVQRSSSDEASVYLDRSGYVTINDAPQNTSYSLSPNPATVNEADGVLSFTVNRSGDLPAETIYASTVHTSTHGYATNNDDYDGLLDEAVNFSSGQTQQTVSIGIINDSTAESDETFGLIIQSTPDPDPNVYLDKTAFTIVDDDSATSTTYVITPNPATVNETAGSQVFTITRSGNLPAETVYASTVNGSQHGYADNNGDYNGLLDEAINFSNGQTQETVSIGITNDATVESNETFGLIIQATPNPDVNVYLAKTTFTIIDSSPTDTPDLLVQNNAVSATPNPIPAGDDLTVGYTLANTGSAAASDSTTKVQIKRASDNALLKQQNFNVATLAAGDTRGESHTLSLPATALDGQYRVYIILDNYSDAGQTQADEANDTGAFTTIAIQQANDPTYSIGDRVAATDSLNVRDAAASTNILVTQNPSEKGEIIGGPQTATYPPDGVTYTWYQIAWDDGNTGWSAENWLVASNPTQPPGDSDRPANILDRPSIHYLNRPDGYDSIDSIVIHTVVLHGEPGSFEANVNYLQSNPAGVSSHFVVGPNGEIAQLVDLIHSAQHAEAHYNGRSIGIEAVVSADDPDAWTDNPLLVERLTELVAWLTAEFDIPVEHPAPGVMQGTAFDHPGILAHSQMSTSGKTDPGEYFPWDAFLDNVRDRRDILQIDDISPSVTSSRDQLNLSVNGLSNSLVVAQADLAAGAITIGESVSINYLVTDEGGSGLDRIELWRKKEGGDWVEIPDERNDVVGAPNEVSGIFTDTPPEVGSYLYGIHAVDNAGNWGTEDQPPGPIRLTVHQIDAPHIAGQIIPTVDYYRMPFGDTEGANVELLDQGRFFQLGGEVVEAGYPILRFSHDPDGHIAHGTAEPGEWHAVTTHNSQLNLIPVNGWKTGETEFYNLVGGVAHHHPGEDWNLTLGNKPEADEEVRAIADGIVLWSQTSDSGYGNMFMIAHRDATTGEIIASLYAHLNDPAVFSRGDYVSRGASLGKVGVSGTNGRHLHFEIRRESMLRKEGNNEVFLDEAAGFWPAKNAPITEDGGKAFISENYLDPSDFILRRWDGAGLREGYEGGVDASWNVSLDSAQADVRAALGFSSDNVVAQNTEGSDAAISRSVIIPRQAPIFYFDYHFTQRGTGDRLVANIDGTEVWSKLGTEYTGTGFQNTGEIDLSAWAGQTVELEIRLATTGPDTGEDQAQAWIDNVIIESDPDAVPDFTQQLSIATAGVARSIHAADLDADGDQDLVLAIGSNGHHKIAWYRNEGGGVFSDQMVISTAVDDPRWVSAADLDNDGAMDVLSASENDEKIAWYRNLGGGVFSSQIVIEEDIDRGGHWVKAADLDNDGDLDVVAASGFSGTGLVAWYRNDGTVGFSDRRFIDATDSSASAGDVADLNGDGLLDVVAAWHQNDRISWYPNNGDGGFGPKAEIALAFNAPSQVITADIDGDDDMDVIAKSSNDGEIAWYANNGAGTFSEQMEISTSGANSIYAADLDDDGFVDIVAAEASGGAVAWYRNNGDGTFGDQMVISDAAAAAHGVYAADIDGDNDLDVAAALWSEGLAWYRNNMISIESPVATIAGRHVFYNGSSFDGADESANTSDDGAIASDKQALLPGQTATFANYSSYAKGINGLIVDMVNLAAPGSLSAGDFEFKTGNSDDPSGWSTAPAPLSVTVREGEGVGGSDRVTVIWADNAIQQQWLQVRVLANATTGLAEADVFYFGNAVGETGDSASHAQVNALDAGGVRDNPHNFLNPALITDAYDINRDERVDAIDYGLVRDNATNFLNDLNLITPPEAAAAPEEAAPTQVMLTTSPETTPSPTTQSVTEPVAVLSGSSVSEAQATSVVEKPTTSVAPPPVPAAIEASSADGDDADARSRGDAFSPQLRRALVAWEHQQRESGRSRRPLLPPRLERFNAAAVLGVGEAEADDGLLLEADAVAGRG